jgi:hypothetical protein
MESGSNLSSPVAACGALYIYYFGRRHSGEDHHQAVNLFRRTKSKDNLLIKNTKRLTQILNIKNMAEYEERLVFQTESEKILRNCERFLVCFRKQLI